MRKPTVRFMAMFVCTAMLAVTLIGCDSSGSTSSSTGGSSASAESSTSAESSGTTTSGAPAASNDSSASAADAASRGSDSILNIDGVDVTSLSIEMVGDTPNLMIIFSNTTANDVDVDLSPFKVVKEGSGEEVNFHLTHTTVAANTPYSQNAFTASPGSLEVGNKVRIAYGDTDLGTFEVAEF